MTALLLTRFLLHSNFCIFMNMVNEKKLKVKRGVARNSICLINSGESLIDLSQKTGKSVKELEEILAD